MAGTNKPKPPLAPLRAAVISATERNLAADVRAAKAALLYSDDVTVFSARASMAVLKARSAVRAGPERELVEALTAALEIEHDDDFSQVYEYDGDMQHGEDWVALLELIPGWIGGHVRLMTESQTAQAGLLLSMGMWDATRLGMPMFDLATAERLEGFSKHTLRRTFPGAPGPLGGSA